MTIDGDEYFIIIILLCTTYCNINFGQYTTTSIAILCLSKLFPYVLGTRSSILGEVRNVEISRVTQQLLCSKSHDFLAVFALAQSKINQIA